MIGFLIGLLLVGLVAGFLARAIMPGRDSMSLGATILLGIAGSFAGGFLADVFFRSASEDRGLAPSGIIGSIVGAVIVLLIYNAFAGRRAAARWKDHRPPFAVAVGPGGSLGHRRPVGPPVLLFGGHPVGESALVRSGG